MPVVPYNIAIAPVIAVCSAAEFRSPIKCRVGFGALRGRTCDLIKNFVRRWESRLLCWGSQMGSPVQLQKSWE